MKIKKMLLSLGIVAVMMCSVCAVNANAYHCEQWNVTDGETGKKGYVYTWLNGGTYTDSGTTSTLHVIGNSSVSAHTSRNSSKYYLLGQMSVNTFVEGSSGSNHKDAANCDSISVAVSGATCITNPKVTSSTYFCANKAGYGKVSFSASVKALD